MTIDWLLERMAGWGDEPAVVWRDRPITYGLLVDEVARWKERLTALGVAPGCVVAMRGDYSAQSTALLLALIELPAIIVPLAEEARAQHEEYMRLADVQVVLSLDEADRVQAITRDVPVMHALTRRLVDAGLPGLIVFSSGSTGESKAALHSFAPLLEKFKTPRYRLRTLTFLLLDHLGGINTLLYALSNGGTVVCVPSRDPQTVCEAIERHRVQLLPTTPTFLNLLLLSEADRQYDLSSLQLITYGTEVMPESTLRRLHRAFPGVRLQQTYGLTELGVLRSKSRDSTSLWVKIGGENVETKVVDGVLWIRAPSAMVGYLNAASPFDAEGWMNTQDMVEVDGEYLRILGRRSDIINVGGQKVYPAEVESVLMQMPNVRDATVRGEPHPLLGHIVTARLVLGEPEELTALKKRVRSFCRESLASYKIPIKIEVAESSQVSARYKRVRRAPMPAFR